MQEILEQPTALRRTTHFLQQTLQHDQTLFCELFTRQPVQTIVLTGMGSSLAAAQYGAYLFGQAGFRSVALDTSEVLYYQQSLLNSHTLLIVISQSGRSAEICKLLDMFGGCMPILGITNAPDSPVARRSTFVLPLQAGVEQAASTKTYTCTLAALYLLVNALRDTLPEGVVALQRLSDQMERTLPLWRDLTRAAAQMLHARASILCLGRGPSFSTASAAELLFQEVAKVPTHAMTTGNFRHGALEALSPKVGYVIFESLPPTRDADHRLARQLGASNSPARDHLLMVGAAKVDDLEMLCVQAEDERLQPLVAILPIQWLTLNLALERGIASDTYNFAQKVTENE
jgi:glucosamine--fructose-6-phosphate aminotransferase (isomerizing)